MAKTKPTGFVARCQCGAIVGAMDYERIDRREAGNMLGQWLHDGCTVEPRFSGAWRVTVEPCRCEPPNAIELTGALKARPNDRRE